MKCSECGELITDDQDWLEHSRLGVKFHAFHDLTNIQGEDVTMHAMFWGFGK